MILYYLFSFKTGEQVFLHQKEERKYIKKFEHVGLVCFVSDWLAVMFERGFFFVSKITSILPTHGR